MKIIIAGGSGFIGRFLEKRFNQDGHTTIVLTRNPKNKSDVYWDGVTSGEWVKHLNGADVLTNMAGKSVDCRYTAKNKQLIYDSRLKFTQVLFDVINTMDHPLKVWLNSSTATIYSHTEDRSMDEETGEIGTGFSMDVATQWESTFYQSTLPKTRRIALRTAIVLGTEGGALLPFKRLVKYGLDGKQSLGNQMFRWIHQEDVYHSILFLFKNEQLEGSFNLSSSNPIDNTTMMKALRRVFKMPFGLPSPIWLLNFGAVLIRTETELVLKSRWVLPKRLVKNGYQFKYSTIQNALESLMH